MGFLFYIETKRHKILFDSGPSEETLNNAKILKVDLRKVDIAILSHGHYDHSGGLLDFAALNPKAKIYMQRGASGENYAFDGPEKGFRYIGIDKNILELPQVVLLDGDIKNDEELSLFRIDQRKFPLPSTNRRIMKKLSEGGTSPSDAAAYTQDDFSHEHCLFIDGGKEETAIISGCAHNGILNIMEEFIRKFGKDKLPKVVISGFHLMKKSGYQVKDFEEAREIAKLLTAYPCKFYTCHCTGIEPYEQMKTVMGNQLNYFHTGNKLKL